MLINLKKENFDLEIYRIIPFDRFLQILVDKALYFINPTLWADPYELFLFKQKILDHKGEELVIGGDRVIKKLFGLCWTRNCDHDYSWRIYTPNNDGVQLKTTVGVINQILEEVRGGIKKGEFRIGSVDYLSTDEIRARYENKKTFDLLVDGVGGYSMFIKRKVFEAENEIRVILSGMNEMESTVFKVNVDPNCLISSIMLDPRLSSEKADTFKKIISQLGYSGEINQSSLFENPILDLRFENLREN